MPDILDAAEAEPSAPSSPRLTTKQVARLFKGEDAAATLLFELALGAYRGENGVTRIGLVEPEVHEHDRWLFEFHPDLPNAEEDRRGWYMRGSDDQMSTCEAPAFVPVSERAMISMLAFHKSMLKNVRMRLLQHVGTYVDATEVLAAAAMLNSMDVNDLVDVDYTTPIKELHLLVHHQEEFLDLHPDHRGIRRSNLMHLYGLADPYRNFHLFNERGR